MTVTSEHAPFEADDRFLVIVPTYNERVNLPRKIPRILEQDLRLEVLVVDDASPDGTGELADQLAERDPRVHVLHRTEKSGLGPAYLDGFRWALDRGYVLVIEMDADISHPPTALPGLIAVAEAGDVAIGSRYVDGRVTVSNWPMSRLLVSYFGSWYARVITRMPIRDQTGGFNAWRREVLAEVDLDRVRSNGYAFQIELKYRAYRRGFELQEIPILFTERDSGESKMSKKIVREAVWRVWWLKIRDLFGRL